MRQRFAASAGAARAETLSTQALDAIRATIDATNVRETQKLNSQMVLLTLAIAGGPFLGLLGTVVGVMITFAVIAATGDVNVNSIAPGIAAALVATVCRPCRRHPRPLWLQLAGFADQGDRGRRPRLHRRVRDQARRALQLRGACVAEIQEDGDLYDEVNVVPMLDLAYVLLVIFIILTTATVQGITVNLPKASAAPSLAEPKTKACHDHR